MTVRAYRISWTTPRSSTRRLPSSAPDVVEAFRTSIRKYVVPSRSTVPVTPVSVPESARRTIEAVRPANGSVSGAEPATR
jgi:hypothetical protein